jgi:hypothetical protein
MAYKAPVRDLMFILNEVLEIDRYANQNGFEDVSSDLVGQILEEGAKFAEEVIAPDQQPGRQGRLPLERRRRHRSEGLERGLSGHGRGWLARPVG